MTWPQSICWLSIYLSLLALCIHAIEVNTEAPNTTLKPTEDSGSGSGSDIDNYDVLDVAKTNENKKQEQTGQTTHIFTTGAVNDDFWLKHLGEDFKYAIHLQVGDSDQYDGIYNMTEDDSNNDIQQDYQIKEIALDGNEGNTQNTLKTQTHTHTNPYTHEQTLTQTSTENTTTYDTNNKIEVENTDKEASNIVEKVVENENSNSTATVRTENQNQNENEIEIEQNFSVAENGTNLIKNVQHSMQKVNDKNSKEKTSIKNIDIKLTQKSKTEKKKLENQKEIDSEEILKSPWQHQATATPIVVTLPDDNKILHQLADENSPVVVKMPPVIYHHNTNYQSLMNSGTHLQAYNHNQYTTPTHHHHQEQQHYEHTDFTQYNPHTITSQEQHYENTDFTQYNPISSSQSPTIPSQQLKQQIYYAPSLIEDSTTLNRDAVFGTQNEANINDLSNLTPENQLQKSPGSIHFILRKPSTPYNRPTAHNQLPLDNSF